MPERRGLAALLLLVASAAWARIGETPEQCAERYGPSVGVLAETGALMYSKSGVRVLVHFHEGLADYLIFAKERTPDAIERFTDNEIQLLLAANGGARVWAEREVLSLDAEWETADGELYASRSFANGYLVITTAPALQRAAEKTAAAEKQKLEGF